MLSLMESGGVGFLFALFATPLWIRFVRERSLGQQIREDGPESHHAKAGTPTMGGVVIVVAAVLGYLMGHVGTSIVYARGNPGHERHHRLGRARLIGRLPRNP